MKQIIINSKRYGQKIAQVDDKDFETISKHKWSLLRSKNNETFYAKTNIKVNGKYTSLQMHCLILKSLFHTDHRDRNGLNNQRSNLRPCSISENMMNKKKLKKGSSEYKGVCWYPRYNKWSARIGVDHTRKCLGYFNTQEEAAIAYNIAAGKLHGEFANLNKI